MSLLPEARRPAEGVLLLDKPEGPTSHDVVATVRRFLGERRVGHAGTLDPFATGLLVLLIGRATRLLPYLSSEPKEYRALVRFGVETTTDDRTGAIACTAELPGEAAVRAALRNLTGSLMQEPPAYSAKQVGGRRAHVAARQGAPLALRPVPVIVHSWHVHQVSSTLLDATVICSGGTYVRSLARDLGRLVGSAAHLAELRRLRSGHFRVDGAVALAELRSGDAPILPALAAVPHLAVQQLGTGEMAGLRHGRPVAAAMPGQTAALLDERGGLAAIATREGELWRPRVVLAHE